MWQYNYSDPDALAHAGGFKYYQKVKTASGTRYFYTPQEYTNYLKGRDRAVRKDTPYQKGLIYNKYGGFRNVSDNIIDQRTGTMGGLRGKASGIGIDIKSTTKAAKQKAVQQKTSKTVSAQKVLRKGEQNLKTYGKDARTYRIGQAVSAQKVLRKGEQNLQNTRNSRIGISAQSTERPASKQQKRSSSKLSEKVVTSNTKIQEKPMSTEDIVKSNLSDAANKVVRKSATAAANKKPTLLDRAGDIYDAAKNEVSNRVDNVKRDVTAGKTALTLGRTAGKALNPLVTSAREKEAFRSQGINSMIGDANRKNKAVSINSKDFTKRSLNSVLKEGKYYLNSGKRAIDSWIDRNSSKRYPVGREISRKTQQFFDDIGHEWRSFKRERKVKKIFGN